jgi:hypothetical protein
MKVFGALKFWMPLAGLGAFLTFAPQSRAQADVSPDHFDENGISSDFARPKATASKAKPVASSVANAQNQKNGATANAKTASSKKPASAQQNQLVAVTEKSKVPPRKRENQ